VLGTMTYRARSDEIGCERLGVQYVASGFSRTCFVLGGLGVLRVLNLVNLENLENLENPENLVN